MAGCTTAAVNRLKPQSIPRRRHRCGHDKQGGVLFSAQWLTPKCFDTGQRVSIRRDGKQLRLVKPIGILEVEPQTRGVRSGGYGAVRFDNRPVRFSRNEQI